MTRQPLDWLTPQERRVLDLIAQGMTNREIGAELGLAEKTVKNYVTVVLAKLGVRRRTHAIAYVARLAASRTLTGAASSGS